MKVLNALIGILLISITSKAISNTTEDIKVSVQGAGLTIAPKQIIFTPNSKTKVATLYLSNSSNQVNTYRLRIIHYKMEKDGSFKEIDIKKNNINYALNRKLRFSPRQVTVGPKSTQVVKVMLRGANNLKDHEYRSRINFITIPNIKKNSFNLEEDEKIGLNLIGLFGISIPVIYWPDGVNSSLKIENIQPVMKEDGLHIKFTATRSGNASNFSNLTFYLKNKGKKTKIYEIKRHFVYYPTERVNRDVVIKDLTKEQVRSGSIEIEVKPAQL